MKERKIRPWKVQKEERNRGEHGDEGMKIKTKHEGKRRQENEIEGRNETKMRENKVKKRNEGYGNEGMKINRKGEWR